jgi:hypothetical protein
MLGDLIYPDVDVLLSFGCYPQGRSHFFAQQARARTGVEQ